MSALDLPRPVISGTVTSVAGRTGAVVLSTGDVSEGGNQYFTNARARSAISLALTCNDPSVVLSGNTGPFSYDSSTGVLSITASTVSNVAHAPHSLVIRDSTGMLGGNANFGLLSADILTVIEQIQLPGGTLNVQTIVATGLIAGNSLSAATTVTASNVIAISSVTIGKVLDANGGGTLGGQTGFDTWTVTVPMTWTDITHFNGPPVINGINGIPYFADNVQGALATTDLLNESGLIDAPSTHLWFTPARVLGTPLSALNLTGALSGKVTTTDPLSAAISKLQTTCTQLSNLLLKLSATV